MIITTSRRAAGPASEFSAARRRDGALRLIRLLIALSEDRGYNQTLPIVIASTCARFRLAVHGCNTMQGRRACRVHLGDVCVFPAVHGVSAWTAPSTALLQPAPGAGATHASRAVSQQREQAVCLCRARGPQTRALRSLPVPSFLPLRLLTGIPGIEPTCLLQKEIQKEFLQFRKKTELKVQSAISLLFRVSYSLNKRR